MHELNVSRAAACTLYLRVVSTDVDCKPRLIIYMDMRLQFEPGGEASFKPGIRVSAMKFFDCITASRSQSYGRKAYVRR